MSNKLPPYPEGHKYYGSYVEETLTDGWCYGAITEFLEPDKPEGSDSGDGFVVAPDGSYCGLVWSTDCPWEFEQIEGPRRDKFWGVFEVRFPKPVRSLADLVDDFRHVLPGLRESYKRWLARAEPKTTEEGLP
jgi:hypothetical protein